ncbi:3-oxo-5-alpha-steroid 4-dehydrogenase-domain-containing protein [Syncephalis pseudoplumigaleata]|uniref:3-oxo-5-alpha-steroid 4-dehydrogenase-domain-containing protein n=1 Tax=Syncephalis pseudoplumigaleata TaxID=1712513 RepID=A0A4P9Z1N0_9FUNG|nr:3-oxo-5-alpha-steroid 4-dehydrogenase-domain-containing protein [Syncephalis pseudoplumigaleata]|eukprot:RKP25862.1 3-oxo-5-alpha-steroid 4-dehydrogenase-domain-containing protein [Syncephalis pseudoplumigaleata]
MQLTIVPRGYQADAPAKRSSRFPLTIELDGTAETLTVDDVQRRIHEQLTKYYPERQRLTAASKVLQPGQSLSKYDIKDGDTITFKDLVLNGMCVCVARLGPQVGWRTVFIVEYFGPLVWHSFFYYCSSMVYGKHVQHSDLQVAAYAMAMGHYLKREFESICIHRFSNGTMPLRNIFKNSFHYHILGGMLIAYGVYGPALAAGTERAQMSATWYWSCIGVFILAELGNMSAHITLRNLRPPGTRVRRVPYGFGFGLVSCPNYTFELIAWAAFALFTSSWAAWFFFVVSFGQIYLWAVKKHKAYRREFPDYPRNRKALIPFIA